MLCLTHSADSMNKFLSALLLLASALLVSCSSITQPQAPSVNIPAGASVHVVKHESSSRDIDKYLRDAFAKRGYKASSGTKAEMPAASQFYVTYVDRWYWDIAMYLVSLEVALHDAKTNAVVNSGRYKNSYFHTFPSPSGKSDELVARLLGKAQ